LRDLARGIFPAILSDQGVVAALQVHATRAGGRLVLDTSAMEPGRRYGAQAEASVFFGITSCLRHVDPGRGNGSVRVALADGDGRLAFRVLGRPEEVGDGELQDVRDRLEAVGGTFTTEHDGRGGVALEGWAPLVMAPA